MPLIKINSKQVVHFRNLFQARYVSCMQICVVYSVQWGGEGVGCVLLPGALSRE